MSFCSKQISIGYPRVKNQTRKFSGPRTRKSQVRNHSRTQNRQSRNRTIAILTQVLRHSPAAMGQSVHVITYVVPTLIISFLSRTLYIGETNQYWRTPNEICKTLANPYTGKFILTFNYLFFDRHLSSFSQIFPHPALEDIFDA